MQLRILPSAFDDLDRGRAFYVAHGEELGDYFLDSLFADIDSLALYAGIHIQVWNFHRMLARRFPYESTTESMVTYAQSGVSWTGGAAKAASDGR
jgi:hypothetical protein